MVMPVRDDVKRGKNTIFYEPCNIYGCEVGDNTKVGAFVEIGAGVKVGKNCKIGAGTFIPTGVVIEDGVFVGPHAVFTNDKFPRAVNPDGSLKGAHDWKVTETRVKSGASIGAASVIVCGVTIGEYAMVAAGAVVTKDVPDRMLAVGVPAKIVKKIPKDVSGEEAGSA